MVIGRVRLFSGFDPEAEGWALREITNLCGLTLGGDRSVEEDHPSSERRKPAHRTDHIRLVSSHGGLR